MVSVVTVITLPLIVGFSMDHFMGEAAPEIDILSLGVTMFMLTALPVTVGMLMRRYSPERTDKIEPGASKLCLLYTSPSPRDGLLSRMPSSA